jgi:hypothetical protein
LSWQATSYVKTLTIAPDGSAVTRSEKLLLLILADYHNTEQKAAWPSARTLAADTLLTVRHVRRVLASVKKRGLICTSQRRHAEGDFDSNWYHFHALDCGPDHGGGSDIMSPPRSDISSRGSDILSGGGDTQTTTVVTPDAQPLLYEDPDQQPVEDTHTGSSAAAKAVCVNSRFDLEAIRQYAWASHNWSSRWNASYPKDRVDGIRNPEGWSIVAQRNGLHDSQIEEYLDDPVSHYFNQSVGRY